MRNLLWAVAAAVCVCLSGAAHADTVDSLTLTSTMGNANGTGTLDILGPLNASGSTTYMQGAYEGTGRHRTANPDILEGLSFSVDGFDFDLSSDPDATVSFDSKGDLSGVEYNGSEGSFLVSISFDTDDSLEYTLTQNYLGGFLGSCTIDQGVISVDPPAGAAVTPEPSSLVLLGTGLMAGVAALRRRRLA